MNLDWVFQYFGWVIAFVPTFALLVIGNRIYERLFGDKNLDALANFRERLVEYPAPPGFPGTRRLTIDGQPVRIRYVAVGPVGKTDLPGATPEAVLDMVIRGLDEVAKKDKPRIKVWPPQPSVAGFAPTFMRLIESPDAAGKESRWVLIAGPAKAGAKPVLLGLALLADEPSMLGRIHIMKAEQWPERLRVQTID